MLSSTSALWWLLLFSAAYASASILYARRRQGSLEDYVVARNSQSSLATVLTLMAGTLGAWILFSPAQAATWGGLAAVIGYALGSASPRLAMIPLGRRMRELMPGGHTLTEFLLARYGRPLYALVLLIMLFYMFIALTAEITAMAKLVTLVAPVPLWVTAAIVMGCTLLYTSYGGLRTSIFTDKVHMVLVLPLLAALLFVGWRASGGAAAVVQTLQAQQPRLLSLTDPVGIKAGFTFLVAILLTGLFHQGNWQRIYAARDSKSMRRGFLFGGMMVAPFILVMGLFGLAFMAVTPGGDSSVALFEVVMRDVPAWFAVLLIFLGLSLVMSSADTTICAISSIVAVDLGRLLPQASAAHMLRLARGLVFLVAIPVMIVAAQGYSVLYLFLLADLLCSAAAFPVFYGLYSRRHDGLAATVATLAGLGAGLALFPRPGQPMDHLLESFLLAALVPVAVTALMRLAQRALGRQTVFDLGSLQGRVRKLG
ncbi:MAG: sodium:solute symporter [Comamonas sp.]